MLATLYLNVVSPTATSNLSDVLGFGSEKSALISECPIRNDAYINDENGASLVRLNVVNEFS